MKIILSIVISLISLSCFSQTDTSAYARLGIHYVSKITGEDRMKDHFPDHSKQMKCAHNFVADTSFHQPLIELNGGKEFIVSTNKKVCTKCGREKYTRSLYVKNSTTSIKLIRSGENWISLGGKSDSIVGNLKYYYGNYTELAVVKNAYLK